MGDLPIDDLLPKILYGMGREHTTSGVDFTQQSVGLAPGISDPVLRGNIKITTNHWLPGNGVRLSHPKVACASVVKHT
jgi:hypothetical protein